MSQSTKKPEYSVEFKQSAVKLAVEGERSIAATARELGVNENTLDTWVGKYHKADNKVAEIVSEQHLFFSSCTRSSCVHRACHIWRASELVSKLNPVETNKATRKKTPNNANAIRLDSMSK